MPRPVRQASHPRGVARGGRVADKPPDFKRERGEQAADELKNPFGFQPCHFKSSLRACPGVPSARLQGRMLFPVFLLRQSLTGRELRPKLEAASPVG